MFSRVLGRFQSFAENLGFPAISFLCGLLKPPAVLAKRLAVPELNPIERSLPPSAANRAGGHSADELTLKHEVHHYHGDDSSRESGEVVRPLDMVLKEKGLQPKRERQQRSPR